MAGMTVAPRRWAARLAAAAGLLVAVVALLLAPATPASAHAVLVSSSPAASAMVPSGPVRGGAHVQRVGPQGARQDPGHRAGRLPGRPGRADLRRRGGDDPGRPGRARGTYLVSYRVISADSHPVSGAFTYSVGAPSTPPVDAGSDTRPTRWWRPR